MTSDRLWRQIAQGKRRNKNILKAYHDSAAGYFDWPELADRHSISLFRLRHSIYVTVACSLPREIALAIVPIGSDANVSIDFS
jgi:hypothetical protein